MIIVGHDISATDLLEHLNSLTEEVVGLDTETSGINPKKQAASHGGFGQIECWSLSTAKYQRVFLWADQLPAFKGWLENPERLKCGHNIYGFDKHMFANHGIVLRGVAADTLRMSRLLYCSKDRKHGLKSLAMHWLGIKQPTFDSLFRRPAHIVEHAQENKKHKGKITPLEYREGKRKVGEHVGVPTLFASGIRGYFGKALEYIPLSEIPINYPARLQPLYEYATADADITRQLYLVFKAELEKVELKIAK